MFTSKELFEALRQLDLVFITGVPDSGLKNFLIYAENHPDEMDQVRSANEGQAIGIASGYHLATGKIPVVYLQNSGLGNTINPLTSLADSEVYGIPMILFVAWRGMPGVQDEPQHSKMGRIMLDMLKVLEVPCEIAGETIQEVESQISKLKEIAIQNQSPVALVFPPGVIAKEAGSETPKEGMRREEALEAILQKIGQKPIVSTTGYTSREIFEIREKKGEGHQYDFLTVGSMGHASSIAFGIAYALSGPVFVIDGDGAVAMQMGALAAIGSIAPKNLFHIVIDNGVHESTGAQPTVTQHLDWGGLFKSAGYKSVILLTDKAELENLTFDTLTLPAAVIVKVAPGTRKDLGRPTTTPVENKEAFIRFLRSQTN